MYDLNGDGVISREEMENVTASVGAGEGARSITAAGVGARLEAGRWLGVGARAEGVGVGAITAGGGVGAGRAGVGVGAGAADVGVVARVVVEHS